MPGRPMSEEQKRKKRERERERQNFSWTLNRLLFLRMSYFKWMLISKTWFSRFFPLFKNETPIFIVNWN